MQRRPGEKRPKIEDTEREVIDMSNYPYQYQQPWIGYQQRPQWYQPQQPAQPMQTGQPVQAVLVTSKAEVEAAQIPFDPNVVTVYVDQAHSTIYTRRFNPQTGGSDLEVYSRQNAPVQPSAPDPVSEQLADLMRRVEALEGRKEVSE